MIRKPRKKKQYKSIIREKPDISSDIAEVIADFAETETQYSDFSKYGHSSEWRYFKHLHQQNTQFTSKRYSRIKPSNVKHLAVKKRNHNKRRHEETTHDEQEQKQEPPRKRQYVEIVDRNCDISVDPNGTVCPNTDIKTASLNYSNNKLLLESNWYHAEDLEVNTLSQKIKYIDQLHIQSIDNYGTKTGHDKLMMEMYDNKINNIYYDEKGFEDIVLWFGYDNLGIPQMNEHLLYKKFNAFRKKIERRYHKMQQSNHSEKTKKHRTYETILNTKRGRYVANNIFDDGNTEKYIVLLKRKRKSKALTSAQTKIQIQTAAGIDTDEDDDIDKDPDEAEWIPSETVDNCHFSLKSRRLTWNKQMRLDE